MHVVRILGLQFIFTALLGVSGYFMMPWSRTDSLALDHRISLKFRKDEKDPVYWFLLVQSVGFLMVGAYLTRLTFRAKLYHSATLRPVDWIQKVYVGGSGGLLLLSSVVSLPFLLDHQTSWTATAWATTLWKTLSGFSSTSLLFLANYCCGIWADIWRGSYLEDPEYSDTDRHGLQLNPQNQRLWSRYSLINFAAQNLAVIAALVGHSFYPENQFLENIAFWGATCLGLASLLAHLVAPLLATSCLKRALIDSTLRARTSLTNQTRGLTAFFIIGCLIPTLVVLLVCAGDWILWILVAVKLFCCVLAIGVCRWDLGSAVEAAYERRRMIDALDGPVLLRLARMLDEMTAKKDRGHRTEDFGGTYGTAAPSDFPSAEYLGDGLLGGKRNTPRGEGEVLHTTRSNTSARSSAKSFTSDQEQGADEKRSDRLTVAEKAARVSLLTWARNTRKATQGESYLSGLADAKFFTFEEDGKIEDELRTFYTPLDDKESTTVDDFSREVLGDDLRPSFKTPRSKREIYEALQRQRLPMFYPRSRLKDIESQPAVPDGDLAKKERVWAHQRQAEDDLLLKKEEEKYKLRRQLSPFPTSFPFLVLLSALAIGAGSVLMMLSDALWQAITGSNPEPIWDSVFQHWLWPLPHVIGGACIWIFLWSGFLAVSCFKFRSLAEVWSNNSVMFLFAMWYWGVGAIGAATWFHYLATGVPGEHEGDLFSLRLFSLVGNLIIYSKWLVIPYGYYLGFLFTNNSRKTTPAVVTLVVCINAILASATVTMNLSNDDWNNGWIRQYCEITMYALEWVSMVAPWFPYRATESVKAISTTSFGKKPILRRVLVIFICAFPIPTFSFEAAVWRDSVLVSIMLVAFCWTEKVFQRWAIRYCTRPDFTELQGYEQVFLGKFFVAARDEKTSSCDSAFAFAHGARPSDADAAKRPPQAPRREFDNEFSEQEQFKIRRSAELAALKWARKIREDPAVIRSVAQGAKSYLERELPLTNFRRHDDDSDGGFASSKSIDRYYHSRTRRLSNSDDSVVSPMETPSPTPAGSAQKFHHDTPVAADTGAAERDREQEVASAATGPPSTSIVRGTRGEDSSVVTIHHTLVVGREE